MNPKVIVRIRNEYKENEMSEEALESTHYLTLARADGVILDTYELGGTEGWNLDKLMGRSVLMDEIRMELERDTEEE